MFNAHPGHGAWRTQVRGWAAAALLAVCWPAQAQQVFFDDFSACVPPTPAPTDLGVNTATLSGTPIPVDAWANASPPPTCLPWTFSGTAWMVRQPAGSDFPGTATQALWLNEPSIWGGAGRMTRQLTGLVPGYNYVVTADTWTDNRRFDTALGIDIGASTFRFVLADGSGPQTVQAQICATAATLDLSLYENGFGGGIQSSPIVTNVRVVRTSSCGAATAEPAPVPVDAPWTLLATAALLGWLAQRRLRR